MNKAILFIDGNNLYHNLKHMNIKPGNLDFKKLTELISKHNILNIQEIYYYNSMPPLNDKHNYFTQLAFIENLKSKGFKVMTRKLQVHSNIEILEKNKNLINSMDLCSSCKPIVEANLLDTIGLEKKKEKGIDVKIAIDIIESSIKRKTDIIILFSGDADFIPALNLAKEQGTKVLSVSFSKGYSYELRKDFKFFVISRNMVIDNCLK